MSDTPVDRSALAQDVLDSLLEGCQVIGFDWTYVYLNDAVARQAGRTKEELLGRTMMECFPGIEQTPMFAELRRCMAERTRHRMVNEFTFPDGRTGWYELLFMPVARGVCVLSIDLTERRRVEAALAKTQDQLRHAQKMEALGRLAGAVAHDFNNTLSVVLSCAQLALESVPPEEPLRHELTEIEQAALHARDLTSQLLALSRKQAVKPALIDLGDTLAKLDGMLQRVIGKSVELRTVPTPGVGLVKVDPGHVQQVVLNLVINACDAMPLGGKLTIENARVDLDEEYAREHLGTMPGPHVMLAVSDTGVGMDPETQSRIFEPFFTTKPAGKGTGLGLSTVFGIVQQSGGSIWVYSEVDKGTTFKIYFPVAEASAAVAEDVRHLPSPRRPGEIAVLVVDDHEQIRRLTAGILQRRGYVALPAATPAEALEMSERHTGEIDVLLTDITMPGMNGPELAERLRVARPNLRVLYMSGYAGDAVQRHGVLSNGAAFVPKPFTPDSLARALLGVLGSLSELAP
jgi:PAS domain S-box-containing protein